MAGVADLERTCKEQAGALDKNHRKDDDNSGAGGSGSNSATSAKSSTSSAAKKTPASKATNGGKGKGRSNTVKDSVKPTASVSPSRQDQGQVYLWRESDSPRPPIGFIPQLDGDGLHKPVSSNFYFIIQRYDFKILLCLQEWTVPGNSPTVRLFRIFLQALENDLPDDNPAAANSGRLSPVYVSEGRYQCPETGEVEFIIEDILGNFKLLLYNFKILLFTSKF